MTLSLMVPGRNTIGLLLPWALWAVAGCSVLSTGNYDEPPLLPPGKLGVTMQASQVLDMELGPRSHQMLATITVGPKSMRIIGLSSIGQRLLSIEYDGQQVTSRQQAAPESDLPIKSIVAQVQLAYWPREALIAAYGAPWVYRETACTRTVSLENTPLFTVTYCSNSTYSIEAKRGSIPPSRIPHNNSEVRIQDHLRSMNMRVKTLRAETAETVNP